MQKFLKSHSTSQKPLFINLSNPMDVPRLERGTSSMSTMRSNQLSYTSLQPLTIAPTFRVCQDLSDILDRLGYQIPVMKNYG
jgi:hypothetical protein